MITRYFYRLIMITRQLRIKLWCLQTLWRKFSKISPDLIATTVDWHFNSSMTGISVWPKQLKKTQTIWGFFEQKYIDDLGFFWGFFKNPEFLGFFLVFFQVFFGFFFWSSKSWVFFGFFFGFFWGFFLKLEKLGFFWVFFGVFFVASIFGVFFGFFLGFFWGFFRKTPKLKILKEKMKSDEFRWRPKNGPPNDRY